MSITVVQSSGASINSGGTTNSATLTGVSASNSLVIVMVSNNGGTPTTPSGYTLLYSPSAGGASSCFFYINQSPSAGTNSPSISFSGVTYSAMSLVEVSGLAASSPLDITNVNNLGVVTSLSVASGTLSQASEILFAALTYEQPNGSANAAITDPPTGFTSLGASQVTINDIPYEGCYQIVSATTSVTPSWSWTDTPVASAQGAIISLKAAGAGDTFTNQICM